MDLINTLLVILIENTLFGSPGPRRRGAQRGPDMDPLLPHFHRQCMANLDQVANLLIHLFVAVPHRWLRFLSRHLPNSLGRKSGLRAGIRQYSHRGCIKIGPGGGGEGWPTLRPYLWHLPNFLLRVREERTLCGFLIHCFLADRRRLFLGSGRPPATPTTIPNVGASHPHISEWWSGPPGLPRPRVCHFAPVEKLWALA